MHVYTLRALDKNEKQLETGQHDSLSAVRRTVYQTGPCLSLSSGVEAGGPAHGGAVSTGQGNSSGSGTAGAQSEDLYTLEAEITELQRENARVESQVLRLRSDITAMENQLKQGEKVSVCSIGNGIPCAE